MKALITGITGQDGAYLAEYLLSKNYQVYGLVRANTNSWRLDKLNIKDKISYVQGDLLDINSLLKALEVSKPQEVYNLASQSSVGYSWKMPNYTAQVTGIGCLNMLDAVWLWNKVIKFYQASSSEMFGNGIDPSIWHNNEQFYFKPNNPYGIAKLFAYHTTVNYRQSYGMFCCNGIAFNHESPLRGMQFVTRKVSDGVARIKLGLQTEIKLGNTKVKRDWGFAGDYVQAMHLMMQQEKDDDYIIATGESVTIEDFLRYAFNYVKLDWRQYVIIDPELYRPNEIDNLVGNYDKVKAIGWFPTVHVKELAEMMVEADLKRYGSQSSVGTKNQRHWLNSDTKYNEAF